MTMIDEKLARLTAVLLDKTKAGKVVWESITAGDEYIAEFSKYGVSVSRVSIRNSVPEYVLSLVNEDGDDIETKRESQRSNGDYDKLEQLFNLARRAADNVEEGLDSILEALERA